MNPTEYKLDLGDRWDDCPTIWHNFVNDIRFKQNKVGFQYLSAKDIDNALEPYHAYRDEITHAIYFAEEKYKNWFLLEWG
jgi:hypothetical protein